MTLNEHEIEMVDEIASRTVVSLLKATTAEQLAPNVDKQRVDISGQGPTHFDEGMRAQLEAGSKIIEGLERQLEAERSATQGIMVAFEDFVTQLTVEQRAAFSELLQVLRRCERE